MPQKEIFARLLGHGLTKEGAAAMMGNMYCESLLKSNNVENRYENKLLGTDESYTLAVNSRAMSREQFIYDQYGYGLCQWTFWSRKGELYDYLIYNGKSIDDELGQVDFCVKELKSPQFKKVYNMLCSTSDIQAATIQVCADYENPDGRNNKDRWEAAFRIFNECTGVIADASSSIMSNGSQPVINQNGTLATSIYWPPRTICIGMDGPDVEIAKAILAVKGYYGDDRSYDFTSEFASAVSEYQAANSLTPDKIIGPKTWRSMGVMV